MRRIIVRRKYIPIKFDLSAFSRRRSAKFALASLIAIVVITLAPFLARAWRNKNSSVAKPNLAAPHQPATAPDRLHIRLARQPEAARLQRRLDRRFLAPGREVTTLIGALKIGAQQYTARITRSQADDGESLTVGLNGGPATLTWDGKAGAKTGSGAANGETLALLERIALTVNFGTTRVFGKTYWINDAICPDAASFVDQTITVIRSIIFPQTEPGLPGKQFTFNYNSDTVVSQNQQWRPNCFSAPPITFTSASQGWGSLSRIVMPSGATVDYTYSWDGIHFLTNPDDAPRESLGTKTLTHDGMTDTWTYGNNPGAGGVTNPDGSEIIEWMYPYDRAFAHNYAGFGGKEGLVYRIDNSGKTRVERHWTLMDFGGDNLAPGPGVVVAFNPVVDAEYTSLMEGGQPVKMSAKTFQYDFNCNLLRETHYDWFDPALVRRN
jgi:hypothetical protein